VRTRRIALATFFAAHVLFAGGVAAQDGSYPRGAKTPTREGARTSFFLGGAGWMLASAFILDHAIRQELALAPGAEPNPLARAGTLIGEPGFFLSALGLTYGAGYLLGSDGLKEGAAHAAIALLASGVANGALKFGIGRCRPRAPCGGDDVRYFALDNAWQSFPSGHTVVAFSLATSLSRKANNRWVSLLAYAGAGMVGWSRIHHDRHWASDVVAGAIVGTTTTVFTLDWLDGADDLPRLSISPYGISVSIPSP